MIDKFKMNGKLIFLFLILAGALYPAGAQLGLSDLPAGAKQYLQTDKYPGIVIPYLGGKLDYFLYTVDGDIYLSGTVLNKCANIVAGYDKDQDRTLRALRGNYSLSQDEALVLVDWTKLIVRLSVLEETIIVPQSEEKDRELLARYAAAKEELDTKLHDYRHLRVRRQGFAATRQLIGYLDKEVKAAEELRAASSLEAPDSSLMIDTPATETTQ